MRQGEAIRGQAILGRPAKAARVLLICLASAAAWFVMPASAEDAVRPFVSGSYAEILAARRDKPFLMVFWSLECPPCYEELAMLGELRREHPRMPMVVVSTDTEGAPDEISAVLAEKGLGAVETWVFADGAPERLRFEVDRAWYGELPRSYLYDKYHRRHGASGRLKRALVEAWLAANVP